MDFYKYLIGFNKNGFYTKVTFPTISSIPTLTSSDCSTWKTLSNSSNYQYYPLFKGEAYGYKVQLSDSRDFNSNKSLGTFLVSGEKDYPVAQEIYGSLCISSYFYTNYIRPADASEVLFIENFKQVSIKTLLSIDNDISATGNISTTGYVEASYFNATSDRRAKTNISIYKGEAIELVKKLPIYTFNYLSDNSASIGMIAQEAAMFDNAIPNFSLVNNEQATGKNGDYMTIKESKLVYILWKAVQEQSKQIEELQRQVEKLSK